MISIQFPKPEYTEGPLGASFDGYLFAFRSNGDLVVGSLVSRFGVLGLLGLGLCNTISVISGDSAACISFMGSFGS